MPDAKRRFLAKLNTPAVLRFVFVRPFCTLGQKDIKPRHSGKRLSITIFALKVTFSTIFFLNKRLFCVIDTYCAFVEALELTIEPREKALLIFLLL